MTTNLVPHGDGLAIVIDPAYLESIRATADTPLQIACDGKSLIITPADERVGEDDKLFDEAVEMVHERFGNAMKKLAE
ncbi:hypothetical protein Mal64_13810 [Pseudobythopirellula maris]|uniref:SpoVT-AbrB domain-containing protein n=1 Tax=Pseudobythopirellula maris TaxID=2527991 RepID=A0A5C5ZTW2_9BACT|nr:AbrB/MazE/SpoVT family DNA-binding domain-containing protein [Pseudobythopirellula maris]TWT90982.1 hypothetical protein Mal64_13810 [Pseudobythopirellula maris]